jgi:quercetin dioxygenase-like cupin family protein
LPPSQLNIAAVRFTPRARSAWQSHDGGQTLYLPEGLDPAQVRGQQTAELNPGDVVFAYGKGHKISAIGLGCIGLSAN